MNQLLVTLYAWHLTAADKLQRRREAGQGSLEYVAAIAVAAIIIAAVVGAVNGAAIGEWATGLINRIKSSVGGG
jgi:heme A synthase